MSDQAPNIRIRKFSRSNVEPQEPSVSEHPEDDYIAPPQLKRRTRKPKQPSPIPDLHESSDDDEPMLDLDDDFLDDLKRDAPPSPKAPTPPPSPKAQSPPPVPKKRGSGNGKKQKPTDDFAELFSHTPTPILGKERREKLTKLHQYKVLFPDELKSFKIKPNAKDEELDQALQEMSTIVECSGIENMLNEAVFTATQMCETVSQRTQTMDVSGLTQTLRANPEVHRILKLIYIKHKVFGSAPPEAQLLLIVVSTAMVCRTHNMKKKEISEIMNTPV